MFCNATVEHSYAPRLKSVTYACNAKMSWWNFQEINDLPNTICRRWPMCLIVYGAARLSVVFCVKRASEKSETNPRLYVTFFGAAVCVDNSHAPLTSFSSFIFPRNRSRTVLFNLTFCRNFSFFFPALEEIGRESRAEKWQKVTKWLLDVNIRIRGYKLRLNAMVKCCYLSVLMLTICFILREWTSYHDWSIVIC